VLEKYGGDSDAELLGHFAASASWRAAAGLEQEEGDADRHHRDGRDPCAG